jgi:enediyne biosynthesis protein E4
VRPSLPCLRLIGLLVALAVLVPGCGGGSNARVPAPADTSRPAPAVSPVEAPSDWFVDRAKVFGLDFTHVNGMSGQLHMVEVLAPGVGLLDYDNDGDLDVYLVQGQPLAPASTAGSPSLTDRLYRNDLQVGADGTRVLRFTDVTRESGIAARGYGMGVATADIDNDGWVDFYLTKFDAPNQLFHNNGDGTFRDISATSGTGHTSWGVSASFVDIDRDGWLDLYVGNYLRYTLDGATPCFGPSGARDYCTPDSHQPLPDRLYRNTGKGVFVDVTAAAQIGREFGPALGVATADFDGDGWMDIYVANDGKENQLWRNRHDGTFENIALLSGVALPLSGKAEASMGVDAADFDDDGDEDLFVTELTSEGSNLFVNDGTATFDDRSTRATVGTASRPFTGFGTGWFDFDNDGRLDLLSVNGSVQILEALRQAGDPFPLHQRKLLFRSLGEGRFEDVGAKAGAVFGLSEVGRGAAFGDVDNDGDVDVLVGNNNGPVRLLINQAAGTRHWIGLRLVGQRPRDRPNGRPGGRRAGARSGADQPDGRDMLGARVEIVRAARGSVWRRVRADGSYASANDPRVHVGLGESADTPTVRVTWPGGRTESWADVAIDRYTTLREGDGQ